MPITLNCNCGKTLRVADQNAGKRVKCPGCGTILDPPPLPPPLQPSHGFVVVEEPAPPVSDRPRAREPEVDDGARAAIPMQKDEKPPPPPRKPQFRKRAGDDHPTPRRRKSGRKARADTEKRYVYIIGGGLALVAGIGLVILGDEGEGRGATRVVVAGVVMGLFGLISLVQGITGNLPDDDDE